MEAGAVRRSAIAGSWYPGAEPALSRSLAGYMDAVEQVPVAGRIIGLVVPHAGYIYSGQTAAYAYRQLRGLPFRTVAVLAPSHRMWLDFCAISTEDAYETPLGRVPIDRELARALAGRIPIQSIRGDGEHAVEIQLPFLQFVLGEFSLLPILTSSDDPALPVQLAQALCDVASHSTWHGAGSAGGLLLIASSDLHHIPDYTEVVRRDSRVVEALSAFDLGALSSVLMDPGCSVCGRIPILTVLHACRLLGADSVRVLHHTNSGDVTGRRRAGEYTVGYVSAAICERPASDGQA